MNKQGDTWITTRTAINNQFYRSNIDEIGLIRPKFIQPIKNNNHIKKINIVNYDLDLSYGGLFDFVNDVNNDIDLNMIYDLLPKEESYESFQTNNLNNFHILFPDDVEAGITKYLEVVDSYKNGRNPKRSIEKYFERMNKKKNKKSVKFDIKSTTIDF